MHEHVFPLLISVEVALVLIAVPGEFVVHPIRNSCTKQCLVVLKSLAFPDNEDVFFSDNAFISAINLRIEIGNYCLNSFFSEILFRSSRFSFQKKSGTLD